MGVARGRARHFRDRCEDSGVPKTCRHFVAIGSYPPINSPGAPFRWGVGAAGAGRSSVPAPDRSGSVDLRDCICLLINHFGGACAGCADASDSDDDGVVTISGAIRTLTFLSTGGLPPKLPFPGPGYDPTPD